MLRAGSEQLGQNAVIPGLLPGVTFRLTQGSIQLCAEVMRVERIKRHGYQQLYGIVRKKTLEYLGGYIQTAELKDMESYICAPGCGGDQGILGAAELARRALA